MPYIDPIKREAFNAKIKDLAINSSGELNYMVTRLLLLYLEQRSGVASPDPDGNEAQFCHTYAELSAARAALTDASDEFYRRVIAPYEDRKRAQNGDVYGQHRLR